jgi:hypothetical protein
MLTDEGHLGFSKNEDGIKSNSSNSTSEWVLFGKISSELGLQEATLAIGPAIQQ